MLMVMRPTTRPHSHEQSNFLGVRLGVFFFFKREIVPWFLAVSLATNKNSNNADVIRLMNEQLLFLVFILVYAEQKSQIRLKKCTSGLNVINYCDFTFSRCFLVFS